MIKELLAGNFSGAMGKLTSTGSVISILVGGIGGFALGNGLGALVGILGGALLGDSISGLFNQTPPETMGPRFNMPKPGEADKDVMKKGKTVEGETKDKEVKTGFTLSPNLDRIKKLEFESHSLLSQTNEAEKIKDPNHRSNVYVSLGKKYKELFKLEANFNEYVKLAKGYNENDRKNLVAAYEALSQEKAALENKAYTGNAEAEAPKLPTPDVSPLNFGETYPEQIAQFRGWMKDNPQITEEQIQKNAARPVVIDENKKLLHSNLNSINSMLFESGSKGETLFLQNASEFTKEKDPEKLRAMWKELSIAKKIYVVETGLSKELDEQMAKVDFNVLAQTDKSKESDKKNYRDNPFGQMLASWNVIINGCDSKKFHQHMGPWDSADIAANFRKNLESGRPSRKLLEHNIDFAIANPSTDAAKAEWQKMKDMLPLIEYRYQSRQAMHSLISDVKAKEVYVEKKLKPYVESTTAFEQKVEALRMEVQVLKAQKAKAAAPAATPDAAPTTTKDVAPSAPVTVSNGTTVSPNILGIPLGDIAKALKPSLDPSVA